MTRQLPTELRAERRRREARQRIAMRLAGVLPPRPEFVGTAPTQLELDLTPPHGIERPSRWFR